MSFDSVKHEEVLTLVHEKHNKLTFLWDLVQV